MIDEEATFEKFGYYSYDLKPKSSKKLIAVCDNCGKTRVLRKRQYHPSAPPVRAKAQKVHLGKAG